MVAKPSGGSRLRTGNVRHDRSDDFARPDFRFALHVFGQVGLDPSESLPVTVLGCFSRIEQRERTAGIFTELYHIIAAKTGVLLQHRPEFLGRFTTGLIDYANGMAEFSATSMLLDHIRIEAVQNNKVRTSLSKEQRIIFKCVQLFPLTARQCEDDLGTSQCFECW